MDESGSGLHPIWGLGTSGAELSVSCYCARQSDIVTVRSYACVEGGIRKAVLGVCLELVSLHSPGATEKIHRNSCVTFEPTRSARPGILKPRVATQFLITRTFRWAVNSPKFCSEF